MYFISLVCSPSMGDFFFSHSELVDHQFIREQGIFPAGEANAIAVKLTGRTIVCVLTLIVCGISLYWGQFCYFKL